MSAIKLILLISGALLFFLIRYRKFIRKRPPLVMEKQILIRGVQLTTPLTLHTPLICLLSEGMKYGEDFKEKEIPHLPHDTDCHCKLIDFNQRSREWFEKNKSVKSKKVESDLGPLSGPEARYYKYSLILERPEISEKERENYEACLQESKVSQEFGLKIRSHLTYSSSNL